MTRWSAKVINEGDAEYGRFIFHDLSDAELLTIAELACRSGDEVSVKFWCEKEHPEDVAHIGPMDYDPVVESIIEEVKADV